MEENVFTLSWNVTLIQTKSDNKKLINKKINKIITSVNINSDFRNRAFSVVFIIMTIVTRKLLYVQIEVSIAFSPLD